MILKKTKKIIEKWKSTVFYGTGEGFGISKFKEGVYKKLEPTIKKHFYDGEKTKKSYELVFGLAEKLEKGIVQKMITKTFYFTYSK